MKMPFSGLMIAMSAAALFACGGDETPDPSTQTQEIKCAGINDCKGHSDCAGANSDCKGLNDCAGTGYLLTASDKECMDKGGTVI